MPNNSLWGFTRYVAQAGAETMRSYVIGCLKSRHRPRPSSKLNTRGKMLHTVGGTAQ